jgi:hypothetical protein
MPAPVTPRAGSCPAWLPLTEVEQRINAGEIVGAGSVAGLLAVLLAKATGRI